MAAARKLATTGGAAAAAGGPARMMGPAYPPARVVAPKVEAHFVRHIAAEANRRQGEPPIAPDADTIEALINAAFWASLRREESYVPKISLAYLAPKQAPYPLEFERRLPLDPASLVKLAPAVERAGIHLGVCRDGDGLSVWGTARTIPPLCLVVEVAAPGLLVIKHHRGGDVGKFVNVAVLESGPNKKVGGQTPKPSPFSPPPAVPPWVQSPAPLV